MSPESSKLATIITPFGLFEPKVVPFGLTNAPAAFQRLMDRILAPVKKKYPCWVHWYMDNVLTAMPGDQKLHDEIVHWILRIFKENDLYLKPKKCRFDQEEVDFLGYVINRGEIRVDPSKQHGLEEWPRRLNNITEVQRTLGLLGYQRQFIPNFARVAHPLHELTKKNVNFEWTEEHTQALDTLIKAITSDPVLL
jgi:Reverse transcriptase (RNA-dependent DNA polymerase)